MKIGRPWGRGMMMMMHLPGIVLGDGLDYKRNISLSCNTSTNADQDKNGKMKKRSEQRPDMQWEYDSLFWCPSMAEKKILMRFRIPRRWWRG